MVATASFSISACQSVATCKKECHKEGINFFKNCCDAQLRRLQAVQPEEQPTTSTTEPAATSLQKRHLLLNQPQPPLHNSTICHDENELATRQLPKGSQIKG